MNARAIQLAPHLAAIIRGKDGALLSYAEATDTLAMAERAHYGEREDISTADAREVLYEAVQYANTIEALGAREYVLKMARLRVEFFNLFDTKGAC